MLRHLIGGLVAAAICWAPGSVLAQPAGKPAAQTAKVDPRAEALVRRYLKAIDFEKQIDTMLINLLPVMQGQVAFEHPELTAAQHQLLQETTLEVMRETFTPRMMEGAVPIYARAFTIPELEAIVAFYESPVGRAITSKTPMIAPQVAELTQRLMPETLEAMTKRLCEKLDCDAPTSSPS